MKNILPKLSFLLLAIILCCKSKSDPKLDDKSRYSSHFRMDYKAIADIIAGRADLTPGETVLLVAKPGTFDSLVYFLEKKIKSNSAEYLGTISTDSAASATWATDFTRSLSLNDRQLLSRQLANVDLGILLPGADSTHVPYVALQDVLRRGRGRTMHFHWSGAYRMDGSPLEQSPMIDELYQNALLYTDYQVLSAQQGVFEKAARGGILRVTTPLGTDISFSIGNRPVTKQDGDASIERSGRARNLIDREIELPAGAVRVAPLEESVEGVIAFGDGQWNGHIAKGVVMTFKSGKVVSVRATAGVEHVRAELRRAGEAGSMFRELAVGLNPLLAVPEVGPRWIPYYGYGAGVIRLSLGDNTELGGNVRGGYVRWNFFPDATLEVNGKVWIKDGMLIFPFEQTR